MQNQTRPPYNNELENFLHPGALLLMNTPVLPFSPNIKETSQDILERQNQTLPLTHSNTVQVASSIDSESEQIEKEDEMLTLITTQVVTATNSMVSNMSAPGRMMNSDPSFNCSETAIRSSRRPVDTVLEAVLNNNSNSNQSDGNVLSQQLEHAPSHIGNMDQTQTSVTSEDVVNEMRRAAPIHSSMQFVNNAEVQTDISFECSTGKV
ncbi:unnamed protein product [Didymodactylos carnosus]|uniref:Uncharacterized protein n=1 Tax=Didymodactylos carnosus TaxID=1234261 RepID=A0A815U8Y6_9BILA|nr:unnamed protein product [Didymodactylos carnosus]CAF4373128.1 unnamed protein product [Didymodactylos carnosus]